MPTFDASIKTRTRVGLDRDAFQPGMGSLSKGGSETEQARIHGNQKEQIFGKHDRYIDGTTTIVFNGAVKFFMMDTLLHTVIGSATVNFLDKHTLLVGGASIHTYIGTVMQTYLAAHMHTHLGARVGTHAAPHQNVEPTSWIDVVTSWTQLASVKQTIGIYKCDAFGAAMAISGVKVDASGSKGAAQLSELKTSGQKAAAELAKTEAKALKAAVEGLTSKLGAMEADAQARVNAMPTVSTSAPFGA